MVPRKIFFLFFFFLAIMRDRWCALIHTRPAVAGWGKLYGKCEMVDSAHPSKRPLMGIITCYGGLAEREGRSKAMQVLYWEVLSNMFENEKVWAFI